MGKGYISLTLKILQIGRLQNAYPIVIGTTSALFNSSPAGEVPKQRIKLTHDWLQKLDGFLTICQHHYSLSVRQQEACCKNGVPMT